MSQRKLGYKFAHNCVSMIEKGKLKVQCGCGKQSSFFRDTEEETKEEQGLRWIGDHTGLIEKKPKIKLQEEW